MSLSVSLSVFSVFSAFLSSLCVSVFLCLLSLSLCVSVYLFLSLSSQFSQSFSLLFVSLSISLSLSVFSVSLCLSLLSLSVFSVSLSLSLCAVLLRRIARTSATYTSGTERSIEHPVVVLFAAASVASTTASERLQVAGRIAGAKDGLTIQLQEEKKKRAQINISERRK